MASAFWQKNIIGGVKRSWLAVVLISYIALYLTYITTISISETSFVKTPLSNIIWKYIPSHAIDYLYKFLLTIPLCYLYFRWMKPGQLVLKIALHIVTMVVFVFLWQKLFYFTLESLGLRHLKGSAQVWDIYITALIYIIQFSFFYSFEYYYQLQKQKDIEFKLRQVSLQNELSAIKAQLNPHFLYNIFNTISASVPPEQERTRELIADLSDLFRYQLKASRTELVPLKDEIEFIHKYLDLEKARFGERLKVKMVIDTAVLEEKVPSMMLQPLVENSLKHGLASLIEGGEVSIKITKTEDLIHFDISDTGVGIKDKSLLLKAEGIGLQNTQLRLEKLYGSTLRFEDNHPKGLKIHFTIKSIQKG